MRNKIRPQRIFKEKGKYYIIVGRKKIPIEEEDIKKLVNKGYPTNKIKPRITRNKAIKTFTKRLKVSDQTSELADLKNKLNILYSKLLSNEKNKENEKEIKEQIKKHFEKYKLKALPASDKPEEVIQKVEYEPIETQTEDVIIGDPKKDVIIGKDEAERVEKMLEREKNEKAHERKIKIENKIDTLTQSDLIKYTKELYNLSGTNKDIVKNITNTEMYKGQVNLEGKNKLKKLIKDRIFLPENISILEKLETGSGNEDNQGVSIYNVDKVMQGIPYFLGVLTDEIIEDKLKEVIKYKMPIFSFIYYYQNYENHDVCHYTSIFCDFTNYKELCYFDSYGGEIPNKLFKKLKNFIESLNIPYMLKFKYNKLKFQSDRSDTCSLFAMFYIYMRYFGFSHKDACNFGTIGENEKKMMMAKVNFGFV